MENLFEMSNVICRCWTFRWTSDWIKIWDLSVVSVTVTHRKISIEIFKRDFLQSMKIDTNFRCEHFFIDHFIWILVRRSWSFEYYSRCRYKRQRIDLCFGRINFETIRISNWFFQVKFFLWKIKIWTIYRLSLIVRHILLKLVNVFVSMVISFLKKNLCIIFGDVINQFSML